MLKISLIETHLTTTMILEGRLTELYVQELELAWNRARSTYSADNIIVDLRDTTFIDPRCERILLNMKQEGARFIACGLSTAHRLEQLGIPCRG